LRAYRLQSLFPLSAALEWFYDLSLAAIAQNAKISVEDR